MRDTLDLRTLALFLAVLDEGGLSRAARRLHLTPGAVSKRLSELEARLGVRLLDRRADGVRPTPAGLALEAEGRRVLAAVAAAEARVRDHAEGLRGEIRLCANPTSLLGPLPGVLRGFLATHPLVTLRLDEQRSAEAVAAVTARAAEIGVFAENVPAPGLDVTPFHRADLVLMVPDGHALSSRRSVRLAEAAAHPFVAQGGNSAIGHLVTDAAARLGVRFDAAIRVTSFEAVRRMVGAGLGLGILPDHCARPHADALGFRCVRLDESWARYVICAGVRRGEAPSAAARLFLAHLLERAHSENAEDT